MKNFFVLSYKYLFILYKAYLLILPFAAYLGVMFAAPEFCGQLSFFGWLPVALYYYFLNLKYQLFESNIKKIVWQILPLLLMGIVQAVLTTGSVWNFFMSAFIYEITTLSIALALMFIAKFKEARGEWFVILLAIFFVGSSGVFTLLIFIGCLYRQEHGYISLLVLGAALIKDLIEEIIFITKLIKRHDDSLVLMNDAVFEKNMGWFIAALFMWLLGMLLIKNLFID